MACPSGNSEAGPRPEPKRAAMNCQNVEQAAVYALAAL
jgi:hypothetical protein